MPTRTAIWRVTIPATAVLLAAVWSGTARAQEAANRLPADVGVLIELDDLAAWRMELEADPLVAYLRSLSPEPVRSKAWVEVQRLLQLSEAEVIDRYFGTVFALAAPQPGDGQPVVVLLRVKAEDAAYAVERLKLIETGRRGLYVVYKTDDDQGAVAVGDGWVIFSDAKHRAFFEKVVSHQPGPGGGSLADTALYKAWMSKLPADRKGTVFSRQSQPEAASEREIHAAALVRNGRDLSVHYAGQGPDVAKITALLGEAAYDDFGPLPASSTLAAATLNMKPIVQDPAAIDRMIAPRTYQRDLAPSLGAPTVLFIGETPGTELAGQPAYSFMVPGAAFRAADDKAAADLNRIFSGLMLIANVMTINRGAPAITVSPARHEGADYFVANIGPFLAAITSRPELTHATLAYGRVGDWYVVCAHERYFQRMIEQAAAGHAAPPFHHDLSLVPADRPIATLVIRAPQLAAHLKSWAAHWTATDRQLIEAASRPDPPTPQAQAARGVIVLGNVLEHFRAASVQLYRGPGEHELHGRIQLLRE